MKILGVLALIAVSGVLGLVVPFLPPRFVFLIGAGMLGLGFLFMPVPWILYLSVGTIFAVLGPLKNFFGIDAQWGGYLLGLSMFVRALIEGAINAGRGRSFIFGWSAGYFLLLFLSVLVFATAISPPDAYGALISLRGFAMLWGFFFVIAVSEVPTETFRRLGLLLAAIGLFQIPLALYQRLFVASERTTLTDAPWDAVVGSFDGFRQLGGDSGGMGIFMVALLGAVLIFWKRGLLSLKSAMLFVVLYCIPVFLAEVKVVYLLIPVMVGMVFARYFRRNIPVAMLAIVVTGAVLYGLDKAYTVLNSKGAAIQEQSFEKDLDSIFKFSTDKDIYNRGGEMGRVTALVFWWEKHSPLSNPLSFFVGDGMASSGGGKFDRGSEYGGVIQQFNYANSTAAILLWDYGVVGMMLYIAMMVSVVIELRKLSQSASIPEFHRGMLEAGSVYVVFLILTLAYNKGLFGQSQPSLLMFVMLMGHAVYWRRRIESRGDKPLRC